MAPSINKGGRPRNAWTPARERKLVRLYTLTHLRKDEIQRLLEAPSFKPSTSDIQKKLRCLFPSDYAKEYKKFRPSKNESNGQLRLRKIRQCGGGRVSKSRKTPSRIKRSHERSALWYLSCLDAGLDPQVVDGSKKFFRNYSTIDTRHIQLPDPICPESSPVFPERLMLDGSMTEPARNSTASSSIISIRSLAKRLSRAYSQNYLEHIRSVLRASPCGSFRSSILSFKSLRSTRSSASDSIFRDFETKLAYEDLELVEQQRIIWEELIDESKLAAPIMNRLRKYTPFRLGPRRCCPSLALRKLKHDFICNKCGFSSTLSVERQSRENIYSEKRDFYGNTSSHYAAAALEYRGRFLAPAFRWLKRTLAENFDAINCHGQTILHMVKLPANSQIVESILSELLHQLSNLGFQFERRDYHGQTSIHALIRNNLHCIRHEALKLIFKISKIATDVLDIFGQSLKEILLQNSFVIPAFEIEHLLLHTDQSSLQERPTLAIERNLESNRNWLNKIITNNLTNWVNDAGNSILMGILKTFDLEYEAILLELVEKLLGNGAQVHMRDRNGDTALTIATVRGFRGCVKLLLNHGANIHTCNFRGVGILQSASKAMLAAAEIKQTQLYSGILTSFVLLVDAGAKAEPSHRDAGIFEHTPEKILPQMIREESGLLELVKKRKAQEIFLSRAELGPLWAEVE